MPRYAPQSVESILFSFRYYNIGDIIHNRKKPIAAILLGLCFIDQAACFRYNKTATPQTFDNFIEKYLPMYVGINLATYVRGSLVHNYSGIGKFMLAWDANFPFHHTEHNGQTVIGTHLFIINIIRAFRAFERDAKGDKDIAKNMTAWSEKHPILVHTHI